MSFKNDCELYRTIGERIKFYREKSGMTQRELANVSKLSISYLSKIEAINCEKSISLSALNQIANALDIDIINFLTEES
ncbi:helix-turn-helix domain-containing protein [Lachnospiraceae bacterium OttesenSCG-928-J05]|nr:helix-turn-helix domain-containing protein [Lachnospiraceae bacterium OttesenSCG-928-J05]